MEIGIKNRIRDIYKNECSSIKSFSEKIGISENTLKNVISRGVSPSYEIIKAIATTFPQYSMDWLITGKGNPVKTDCQSEKNEESSLIIQNNEQSKIIVEQINDIVTKLNNTIIEKDKEIKYLSTELINAKDQIIEILKSYNLKINT